MSTTALKAAHAATQWLRMFFVIGAILATGSVYSCSGGGNSSGYQEGGSAGGWD